MAFTWDFNSQHSNAGNTRFYILTSIVLLIFSMTFFLRRSVTTHTGPSEPPVVSSKVPLVGHLLGLIQHDAEYLSVMISRTRLPIFTLKIFNTSIHIINSPEMVQAVFRSAKTISMEPIALAATSRLFGTPNDRLEMLKKCHPGSKDTVIKNTHHGMSTSMSPGRGLLEMNARALRRFAAFLKEIDAVGKRFDLYAWLTDCFTLASAEALYGPINPISEDRSLIRKLQYFEGAIGLLFLNIFPSITAPKANKARAAISAAFKSYYDRDLQQNASSLVQTRYRILTAGGLNSDDLKDWDVGILIAATMNSFTGMFWLIAYIYSDPSLLSEIRDEIISITSTTENSKGEKEVCFDVSSLPKKCPLFVSAWKETLRLRNASIGSRVVDEETILSGTYLLKKGSVVQIPMREMHVSAEIWGSNAGEFDAHRFMKEKLDRFSREQIKMQKQAFNPFGGGSVLCPGRHFATTEILGVAATIILGYDLCMEDKGVLKVPDVKKQLLSVTVLQPVDGLDVLIKRREGFEGVIWTYDVGENISTGDLVF